VVEGRLIDWMIDRPLDLPRLPVDWLSKEQKAAELQRVQGEKAAMAAYEAELICGLADDTPDSADPPPDHPGARGRGWAPDTELPGVSEFFPAELSMLLNCGRLAAARRAWRAWIWREHLPATRAALAAGRLDEMRAAALAEVLGATAPEISREVEQEVLPEAADLWVGRLKSLALEVLLAYDAAAADRRREQAQRAADVRCYPSESDGMSTLAADLPTPVAAECYDLVDQLATMRKADGDDRPIGQLRAAVLADLIRRPWEAIPPGVSARLTVLAPLSSLAGRSTLPGAVNGLPITAGHLRELAAQLAALGITAPDGGTLTLALTDDDGALRATLTPAQLQRLARRGCPAHPDGDCGCPLLGRPPATDAYEPTDPQRAFVTTRDRRCRFPNCGQRVGWADLDHVIAHADGGETSCENLCCLCRSHHRLKTFAPGWRFVMDDDGTLHVTTPSGITRTTRPPGMRPPVAGPPTTGEDPPPPQPEDPPPF
jgi:hypothetical protein